MGEYPEYRTVEGFLKTAENGVYSIGDLYATLWNDCNTISYWRKCFKDLSVYFEILGEEDITDYGWAGDSAGGIPEALQRRLVAFIENHGATLTS